jgi:hypothetical protein
MVREHNPQADDVAPGNAGMLRAEVLAEGVRRLADDLQETLRREPPDPVLVPVVPAKLDDLGDFAGGIQYVGDALVVPAGSQVDRLREDRAVAAFQPAGRDDVDGPAEQRLKFTRHAYQVEQGTALVEVNEQVDVAVGPVLPARRGAEEANPARVMAGRDRHHLLAPGLDQHTQRPGHLVGQLSHLTVTIPCRLQDNNGTAGPDDPRARSHQPSAGIDCLPPRRTLCI